MIQKTAIQARIKRVYYQHLPMSTTTIAHITLDNGFSVVGQSAAADPAEFNAELGEQYAYEDAIDKLFPHFAFLELETKHKATK